jgi:hypothetical protein
LPPRRSGRAEKDFSDRGDDFMRGFYEDYTREKQSGGRQRDSPVMIRRNSLTAVSGFFRKLFTAVLYIAATALSSVGLTTLINKPLRDMLFGLARKTFFGN